MKGTSWTYANASEKKFGVLKMVKVVDFILID